MNHSSYVLGINPIPTPASATPPWGTRVVGKQRPTALSFGKMYWSDDVCWFVLCGGVLGITNAFELCRISMLFCHSVWLGSCPVRIAIPVTRFQVEYVQQAHY